MVAPVAVAVDVKNARTKEPRYTKLTQQTLPACKPVLQPIWIMAIFFAVGTVMVPIGVICLIYGLKAVELRVRYDQSCLAGENSNADRQAYLWAHGDDEAALNCNLFLNVSKDMKAPVYIYYELNGFYQNHRRYVKSRSDEQLLGKDSSVTLCKPQDYLGGNKSLRIDPCGLTAWSFFNDSYAVTTSRSGSAPTPLAIRSKGIALKSDVENRFGDYTPKNFNPALDSQRGGGNITTTLKQDERFIIWMRLSAMPKFRKLWGVIDTELKAGDSLAISIANRYNTYSFDGGKALVLSTTTWLGGHNPFLGIAFLGTGGVSYIFCFLYLLLKMVKPRKFADPNALSFHKSSDQPNMATSAPPQ